jgi:hypothetical protein
MAIAALHEIGPGLLADGSGHEVVLPLALTDVAAGGGPWSQLTRLYRMWGGQR